MLILLLMTSVLVGCSSNQSASEDLTDNSGEGSTEKSTTISFIHWRGEDAKIFEELISKFEEENTNINVEMTIYPSEQYQSTAQTMLRDGSTGDVFVSMPGSQFEIINKAGLFTDLTNESFVTNFNESLLKAGQKDGKQLALPLQLVFNQPVYNVGIFEKLGLEPADSWEGFLELSQTLKDNGYIPIAFPGADIGPGQLMNSMMMNNAPDEEIFTKLESGETTLTDEWWVKTLSQFKELNDRGFLQENSLGTKHDGAIALVAQEKAAMLATGSYAMASIKSQNPDIKLNLLAPITVPADQAKYEGIHTTTFMLAINSKSEKQAEAKKFIEFLSQPENATTYANATGQHLTVKGVEYNSPELQDTAVWMDKNTRFQPRYLIKNADVQQAVISSIQAVLGGTSPEEAAANAQQIVDQNIK